MRHTLVGCTGFVGGNLAASHTFDGQYHSRNIAESYGQDNGLVVYSGMPSEKFLANADPEADLAQARQALDNMRKMRPQRLVLISTVDVYPSPQSVCETDVPTAENAPAYGKNRLALEGWVREEWPDALILRLPALYGKGLKKNFLYDMLTITPGMLTEDKYLELSKRERLVAEGYKPGKAGFYRLWPRDEHDSRELRSFFAGNDFNALSFTDSRAAFQFYGLSRLWGDIERCLEAGLTLVNLAVEPVLASELHWKIMERPFANHKPGDPPQYDMRTCHADVLGGSGGYLQSREQVMEGIRGFVQEWESR